VGVTLLQLHLRRKILAVLSMACTAPQPWVWGLVVTKGGGHLLG
jgi:hypothetical protein